MARRRCRDRCGAADVADVALSKKMGADMEIEFCRKSAKNQGGSCRPSKAVLGKGIIKVHNIKVT
jgi:hypothetical protein